jgi:hypothetical protein
VHFNLLKLFILLGLLSACGGGGGPVTVRYSTVKTFSDNAGVAVGVASNGQQQLVIMPEVRDVVAELNANSSTNPSDVYANLPVTSRTAYADIRSGTVIVDGVAVQALLVDDNGGDAKLVYAYVPGAFDVLIAQGSSLGSVPSGTFTYTGTHGIGDRLYGGAEIGTFRMSTDFTNKTFSYNGTTTNSSLSGTGSIDTATGVFGSASMSSRVYSSTRDATLLGMLHGSSAQSTSGVFYTNEANPRYAGGFAGSR